MIPDYIEIKSFVEKKLKPSRLEHSLGVVDMATFLSKRFSLSLDKARVAGIYHDAYRYEGNLDVVEEVKKGGYDVYPEEMESPMLLHGPLAAVRFDSDSGVSVDRDIKDAVRHHTLGHKSMGPLGAVIFISDYAEVGRKHINDKDREHILSYPTLEEMIIYILDSQREYFEREGIKEAGVSKELYSFLKMGGRL